MKSSEEQIKEIARWREDLVKQIDKHTQAIEILEKRLLVLDSTLKESSFTKASSLDSTKKLQRKTPISEKNLFLLLVEMKARSSQMPLYLQNKLR